MVVVLAVAAAVKMVEMMGNCVPNPSAVSIAGPVGNGGGKGGGYCRPS